MLALSDHVIHGRISILAVTAPIPTILLGTVVSLMTLARIPLDHKVARTARVDSIAAAAFLSTIGIYQVVGFSFLGSNFPSASAEQIALVIILACATGPVSFSLLALCLDLMLSGASLEIVTDLFRTKSHEVQVNIRS